MADYIDHDIPFITRSCDIIHHQFIETFFVVFFRLLDGIPDIFGIDELDTFGQFAVADVEAGY